VTQTLTSLISSYGVLAVFALMTAESCGVPFPSEIVMPVGGVLAALGHLPLVGVILAGTVGNLAGSLIAYALAARFGEPLLVGPGRWIGIRRSHLDMARHWFGRYGLAAVFFGRVLPVIRTYISFPAGFARVRLAAFAILTTVGALPWCTALAAVGYELRSHYEEVSGPIGKIAIVLALVVAVVLIVWFIRGRRAAER
jgi:membrane protein DedA with SNARE-associated domain